MNALWFTSDWNLCLKTLEGMNGALTTVAFGILVITFLMGIYESFVAGPSFARLGTTVLKYAIASLLLLNWTPFMHDVAAAGASVGQIFLNGHSDVFTTWGALIQQSLHTGTTESSGKLLLSIFENGFQGVQVGMTALIAGILSAVLFFVGMLIFKVAFVFWGGVLYAVGPLLVACAPSGITGNYTAKYAKSLVEWTMWPALYCLIGLLMYTMNLSSYSTDLSTVVGATDASAMSTAMIQAMVSVLYAVSVILIPFIAHMLIGADFTGVFGAVTGAITSTVSMGAGMAVAGMNASVTGNAMNGAIMQGLGGGVPRAWTHAAGGGGGGSIGGGGSATYNRAQVSQDSRAPEAPDSAG